MPLDEARSAPAMETAPAKVNLSLHVVGRRADGYHRLDGLVVFTAFGDVLTVRASIVDELALCGPAAAALRGHSNILGRVVETAREIAKGAGLSLDPLHVELEKNIPVAAGVGGGSADAAALLRLLARSHPTLEAALFAKAISFGADVPMCLGREPVRISGIGETTAILPRCPGLSIVLVNPGVPLSTPSVFSALRVPSFEAPPAVPAAGFGTFEALCTYLDACRNDLQPPAIALEPAVETALDALRAGNARLARMSGSGATCFGLFETDGKAEIARAAIAKAHPHWFTAATTTYASRTETPNP